MKMHDFPIPGPLLSNSNPTWNSTELELVRVGVDFVFQCHKKNKNKNNNNNNPHLILLEGNDLHELESGFGIYGRGLDCIWTNNLL